MTTTDKPTTVRSTLARSLSGEVSPMGEESWAKAYHELSRQLLRVLEEKDALQKEIQKLRLSLMMFGDERFEN
jgi:hypothetical protein